MTLKIAIFGLSITSSWGNGHATTYRALVKALAERGHRITFLERNVPWYRENRDLPKPSYCKVHLYESLAEVPARFGPIVSRADLVIIGSFVPDAAALADWVTMEATGVTAFYDIDTPVTLAGLEEGDAGYMKPSLIPRFDLYFSFAAGTALHILENVYGSPRARALYCSVDPEHHRPVPGTPVKWDLGYLGTYSKDRQAALERLLLEPARRLPGLRFVVAGPQFPPHIDWPGNVERIEHLPPHAHPSFYCAQRFTLNVTRTDMVRIGYSPSVRLFEAAACGTPIISDTWPGIESIFAPGEEILLAQTTEEVVAVLTATTDRQRLNIAERARNRVLESHSAQRRATEVEACYRAVRSGRGAGRWNGVEAVL